MALKRLAGTDDCYDGDTCPTIYEKTPDTLVVQGYLIPDEPRMGWTTVKLPFRILTKAAERLQRPAGRRRGGGEHDGEISFTSAGMVLVRGPHVPASELTVPEGEAAVAISTSLLLTATKEMSRHVA